jgi:hypothetical protein
LQQQVTLRGQSRSTLVSLHYGKLPDQFSETRTTLNCKIKIVIVPPPKPIKVLRTF